MDELVSSVLAEDYEVLADLWRSWSECGDRLDADSWERFTRLPGWTVRDLFAHVARSVHILRDADRLPVGTVAEVESPAEYYRSFHESVMFAKQEVDRAARMTAARAGSDLVRWLRDDGPKALEAAKAETDRCIRTVAGSMSIGNYVVTRIVEAAVHLLDLNDCIEMAPLPKSVAVRRVVDVLVELEGVVQYVERASGRRSPTQMALLT